MDTQIVLSKPVVQGLKLLGTDVPLDLTKKIIENVIKSMLNPDKNTTAVTELNLKYSHTEQLAEYAIVTLLTEAIKNCCDGFKIRTILEEHSIDNQIIIEIEHSYTENRKNLILQQIKIGQHFPHITEVQWRIVNDIKSSTCAIGSDEICFQINLGRFKQNGEYETVVDFLANTEELQSILNKLKEIERHCVKCANE